MCGNKGCLRAVHIASYSLLERWFLAGSQRAAESCLSLIKNTVQTFTCPRACLGPSDDPVWSSSLFRTLSGHFTSRPSASWGTQPSCLEYWQPSRHSACFCLSMPGDLRGGGLRRRPPAGVRVGLPMARGTSPWQGPASGTAQCRTPRTVSSVLLSPHEN